jgi:hypothetical protein
MLHVEAGRLLVGGAGSTADSWEAACEGLLWLDRTVRFLNSSSALRDAVLLTVVLTPGAGELPGSWLQAGGSAVQPGGGDAAAGGGRPAAPGGAAAAGSCPAVLRPPQSWQSSGGAPVEVAAGRPLLCLRRLPSVVRRDGCSRLCLADWRQAGQGALLAERLIPELAYKMGCSLKYGA